MKPLTIVDQIRRADARSQAAQQAERFVMWATYLLRGGNEQRAYQLAAGANAHENLQRVMKAQVAGMTTTDAAALAALQELGAGFLEVNDNSGVFDRMLADMLPGVLHTRYGIVIGGATGGAVAEGRAKPVGRLTTTDGSMQPRTAVALLAMAKQLANSPSAAVIVERALRKAVAAETDKVAFPVFALGAPSVNATGFDAAAIRVDLRRALAAIPTGTDSRLHLAMGTAVAKRLAVMPDASGAAAFPEMTVKGGVIANMPAHVTDRLTSNVMVIDAAAFVAASESIELAVAEHTSLEMETEPTSEMSDDGSPTPSPTESNQVSMFQTNSVALRAERVMGLDRVRAGAVVIEDAGSMWGLIEGSPPV